MRRTDTHDLIVIGAGSAGLTVAGGVGQLGLKVALIERARMGGECLNTGCVPSKALIAAARRAHALRTADAVGIGAVEPRIDFLAVLAHVKAAQAIIAPHDSRARFEGWGVEVIAGDARLVDGRTVEVGGRRLAAPRIVLATGSKPAVPKIEGLDKTPFLTNETVFDLQVLPKHLLILGAGAVGLEMAQAFRRLGSRVTVLEKGRALPRDDEDAVQLVLDHLAAENIEMRQHVEITRISATSGGVRAEVEDGAVDGDVLFVATGRTPVLDGLGLEAAGVTAAEDGIRVDRRLRTSNPRIYAIGDCRQGPGFSHVAGYEGALLVKSIGFGLPAAADYRSLPWVTFTDPELAQIGLTEAAARKKYGDVDVRIAPLGDNDRAVTEAQTAGFVKVVRAGGKLRGATVVGAGAGELALPWVLAIGGKASLSALSGVIAPYPTLGEASKAAAFAFSAPVIFGHWAQRWVKLVAALRR
jgi:pyruvate/2-oxoglutarate dehydrogenase complex dihydrolipoamide dehydrogenase (E3) component